MYIMSTVTPLLLFPPILKDPLFFLANFFLFSWPHLLQSFIRVTDKSMGDRFVTGTGAPSQ